MPNARKIMGWSKCSISVAEATGTTTMPSSMTSIGTIKDKSSVLESQDGDALSAKATGGVEVAHEEQEGTFTLTTRVIETDGTLEALLGVGSVSSGNVDVFTHVPNKDFAVKVEPKNVGAFGIEAPLATLKYKPGWSEEEGNFVDLVFNILKVDEDPTTKWYTKVKKVAAGGTT